MGCNIEHHSRLDRCMTRMRQLLLAAENGGTSLPCGMVVIADELNAGAGRFSRSWHAPAGGVWLAIAWSDSLLPEFARLLPMAAGTACCETLRRYGIEASCKWVNDVHVREKKIAGILTETILGPESGESYHLIGIGINCNNTSFPKPLRSTAVSARQLLNRPVDLQKLTGRLLAKLTWNFGLIHYEEEQTLQTLPDATAAYGRKSQVVDGWRRVSDTVGRRVCYGFDVVRQPLYEATVLRVNDRGGLVMRLDDHSIITEYGGEIIYLDAAGNNTTGNRNHSPSRC